MTKTNTAAVETVAASQWLLPQVGQELIVLPSGYGNDHFSGAAIVEEVSAYSPDVLVRMGSTLAWFHPQRLRWCDDSRGWVTGLVVRDAAALDARGGL